MGTIILKHFLKEASTISLLINLMSVYNTLIAEAFKFKKDDLLFDLKYLESV